MQTATTALILLIFTPLCLAETKLYAGFGVSNIQFKSSNLKTRIAELNKYAYGEAQLPKHPEINTSSNSLLLGWLINDFDRVELVLQQTEQVRFYTNNTQNISQQSFSVQNYDIFYYHCFNNQGIKKGFYLGAGLSQILASFKENTETKFDGFTSLDFTIGFGYQYQVTKNLLITLDGRIPNIFEVSLSSKNKKELQYKKLPSSWGTKSTSYQASNRHKYFGDFFYKDEATYTIIKIGLEINYIFD